MKKFLFVFLVLGVIPGVFLGLYFLGYFYTSCSNYLIEDTWYSKTPYYEIRRIDFFIVGGLGHYKIVTHDNEVIEDSYWTCDDNYDLVVLFHASSKLEEFYDGWLYFDVQKIDINNVVIKYIKTCTVEDNLGFAPTWECERLPEKNGWEFEHR